ncbi:MAG: ATP-dependent helicase/nuclease subunit B [Candidatus Nitrotoga sp. SPKER]|nr:MAG: ATP-dependent helicase/nuclease subunit B [Candidatus Nitrotoga sp. SPKER]
MNPIPQSNASNATVFFDSVARVILTQHSHEIPDLRRARVLLPNYHVLQPLAQSLACAANLPALLLPQMVTLADWVQSVPLTLPVIPDTCRITTLYQALRARRWFADADLWSIARELLILLDELTQNHVTLPQNAEDFLSQLEQAYQSKRGIAMQFEARVVYELWYAMNSSGEFDTARAYQQSLAQLAQQAELPLYVLLTSDLAATEARFLEAYHKRAPVMIFDLREMSSRQPEYAVMRIIASSRPHFSDCAPTENNGGMHDNLKEEVENSFSQEMDALSLREQAVHLQKHFPHAAWGHRLRFFGAHGLEQEARAAEVQIRRWLLAGKKNIAIVAQDRLVARRMRALLERAGVMVCDETGWKFSTLSVSTVLMRWLDALQSDFYYQDLLDLLKSPFIFADQAVYERKQTVYQLEQLVRKHGVVAHLDAFLDLTQGHVEMQMALIRLRRAAEVLHKKNDTLSGWLQALYASLEIIGVAQGLKTDDAGLQLLQVLQNWQRELHADTTRVSLTEWRHWLAQQLDEDTFRDVSIDSPVLLTHLAATRWRSFDAVLMLGCDAAHLPGADNSGRWFNDAVRTTLGLPTREVNLAQQRDDLLALLVMNDTVLVTWQTSKSGEANLLSPWFEMLGALHELAYADDLTIKKGEWDRLLERSQMRSAEFPLPPAAARPTPVARPGLIPKRISASGYNSLVACPYQFYARHILHLNEMDEVREDVEKRDYGEWVHDILRRFHEQYPVLGNHLRADLDAALLRISVEIFAPAVQRDYLARGWLLRWQQAIPLYLDEQLKNEAEGWRYQSGEVPFELPLTNDLLMHGRIDRVDVKVERSRSVRVLDYKMMDAARLRNKLKEAGEDVQLACYAYVYEAEEAAFISIEKDKVIAVAPPQDMAQLAQANIARLLEVFAQIRSGAALPAHGVAEACQYCEMRGLCRRSEWDER